MLYHFVLIIYLDDSLIKPTFLLILLYFARITFGYYYRFCKNEVFWEGVVKFNSFYDIKKSVNVWE